MAKVIFKRRKTAEIASVPIVDGQLIYDVQTGETYMDVGSKRIKTGGLSDGVVLYIQQELTEEEKQQARTNIGAISAADITGKLDLAGGTMTGAIDMGNNSIDNVAQASLETQAVNLKQLREEIGKLGSLLTYKGDKGSFSNLPIDGNKVGDVWYVKDESVGYVWIEENGVGRWEKFGPEFDFSMLVSTEVQSFSPEQKAQARKNIDAFVNIHASGAPTTNTEGTLGVIYMDEANGDLYKCTSAAPGNFVWEKIDHGHWVDETLYTASAPELETKLVTLPGGLQPTVIDKQIITVQFTDGNTSAKVKLSIGGKIFTLAKNPWTADDLLADAPIGYIPAGRQCTIHLNGEYAYWLDNAPAPMEWNK